MRRASLTVFVAFLAMIGPFSIDTYLPAFPLIETEFGTRREMLNQSLAVYLIAFGISSLLWGPLADRYGRRRILFFSLGGYLVATMGCLFAQSIEQFILFRFTQGFVASGSFIAGRAMIRDVHDLSSAHRALSHVMMLFAVAPAIAPIVGALLMEYQGWRAIFGFLALFALVLLYFSVRTSETLPAGLARSVHPGKVARLYLNAIRHRYFVSLLISLSFSFAGLFIYIAGAPTVIYDFLGLESHHFSYQFTPMVIGLMLGSMLSGRLARHWSVHRVVSTGYLFMLLSVLLNIGLYNFLPTNLFTVISPMVVYAFGMALVIPGTGLLAIDCFPQNRGAATAVQGFVQTAGNAMVASFIVPIVQGSRHDFLMGHLLLFAMGLVLWLSLMPLHERYAGTTH